MRRRRTLPGADELFRSTGDNGGAAANGAAAEPASLARVDELLTDRPPRARDVDEQPAPVPVQAAGPRASMRRRPSRPAGDRRPSGRERHDEKITVYVSAEELMDLEHARLTLRGDHGLAVDRGHIVREALSYVLADLDAKGDASILVRRVRGR